MTTDDPIEDAYQRYAQRLEARTEAVWTLLGRLDYFLEVCSSLRAAERRKLAAQLRAEIQALMVARPTTTPEDAARRRPAAPRIAQQLQQRFAEGTTNET